jgi:hypothetical protein
MIWAAAAIPHAIFGFVISIYIILAKRFQAIILGQVTIDNHPAQIATVSLYKKLEDGNYKIASRKLELDERGRFTFSIWQKKGIYKYKIKSKMHMSDEKEINDIEISRGDKKEMIPINLTSIEITDGQNTAPNFSYPSSAV